jgi:hypothetical protein
METSAISLDDLALLLPEASSTQSDEEVVVLYLSTRDVPCPSCRYNLRQLTTARCPECGARLEMSIRAPVEGMGAWIACLLACALPAGVGCFVVCELIYELMWKSSRLSLGAIFHHMSPERITIFAYFIAMIAVVLELIVRRRGFIRLRKTTQVILAILAWALLLCMLSAR